MTVRKFGPLEFAFGKDPMAPVLGFSVWRSNTWSVAAVEFFVFHFVFSVKGAS
jgi:hypothetical protein